MSSNKLKKVLIQLCLIAPFIYSCQSNQDFKIENPSVLTNYQTGQLQKNIWLDYTDAIDSGFIIPSRHQTDGGFFKFQFTLVNSSSVKQSYYYKLFYQNESYKNPEAINNKYNPLSAENFYGSWENENDSVRKIVVPPGESVLITDSFRIVGNPRNERIYFGKTKQRAPSVEEINSKIVSIKNDATWYNHIVEKSKKEGRTIEEQLKLDAFYVINEDFKSVIINNRWKRNPRTGNYNFQLLVFTEDQYEDIPEYITNTNKRSENNFVNPFYYLRNLNNKKNIVFLDLPEKLNVKANPDAGNGIYINMDYANKGLDTSCFNSYCNNQTALYKKAAFEQFFHYLSDDLNAPNIPVISDLQSSEFTMDKYHEYQKNYPQSTLLKHTNKGAQCACETVVSDSVNHKILMWNPGVRSNKMIKENTGVRTRHGLTYGTYTFKVKMPELLNEHNMFNGITNAMWMINQINEPWNQRRACDGLGFIPKEIAGEENSPRAKIVSYSEIDFEIRKGSNLWPKSSYPKNFPRPTDFVEKADDITVLCTNWDLACNTPDEFKAGAFPYRHNDNEWVLHRWNHWYQAISSKYAASDDELFKNKYYYFQIQWKPESITWRIGPEKNKLREVCYMDSKVTDVPNNQMLIVLTQEYHISEWWPEAPILQEYIPFPSKNIVGEILSIEIE